MVILSGAQSDLVNAKESILPVCDIPYHTIKENLQQWAELEHLWNYAWVRHCLEMYFYMYYGTRKQLHNDINLT